MMNNLEDWGQIEDQFENLMKLVVSLANSGDSDAAAMAVHIAILKDEARTRRTKDLL